MLYKIEKNEFSKIDSENADAIIYAVSEVFPDTKFLDATQILDLNATPLPNICNMSLKVHELALNYEKAVNMKNILLNSPASESDKDYENALTIVEAVEDTHAW